MTSPRKDGPVSSFFGLAVEVLKPRRASLMLRSVRSPDELIITQATGIEEEIVRGSRIRIGMPIAGRVAAEKQPLLINDIHSRSDLVIATHSGYETPSFASVPVLAEDQVLGVMNMADKIGDSPFSDTDLFLLMRFAHHLSNLLRYEDELRHTHELANTDPLTGLLNRRVLAERLPQEIEWAKRSGQSGCVLMVELCNLKAISQVAGRLGGDAALVRVAQLVTEQVLRYDAVFRLDGAQFIVLLPRTTPEQAHRVALRIQNGIAIARPVSAALTGIPLAVKVGEASFPGAASSTIQLIEQADESLLKARPPSLLLARLKKA